MTDGHTKTNLAALRVRAEEVLSSAEASVSGQSERSDIDLQKLVLELRVYQTELELQNGELIEAQAAEMQSSAKYRSLFSGMPLPALLCDANGVILEANTAALAQLGLRHASVKQRYTLAQFVDLEQRASVQQALKKEGEGDPVSLRAGMRSRGQGCSDCEIRIMPMPAAQPGGHVSLVIVIDKRQENDLRIQRQRLQAVLDGTHVGIWEWNVASGDMLINERSADMLGFTLAELEPLTMSVWAARIHPDDAPRAAELLEAHCAAQSRFYDCELRMRHKDGHWVWMHAKGRVASRAADGTALRVAGTHQDICARKCAEFQLEQAASVFAHANEGIMITSPAGEILDVNLAFTELTGYARDEVVGRSPRVLKSGMHDSAFYREMWGALAERGRWQGEIWNRRKNGEVFPELLTVSAVPDAQGGVCRYVALYLDISDQKRYERQLEYIAHYDALTGLPNRVLLADRLRLAMAQAQRRGQHIALVYIDLDSFKAVNDNHGHDAGDRLLVTLSERMKRALREGDTLARLGGDEFVAVLVDLPDVGTSLPWLYRILTAVVGEPVHDVVGPLQVSASLGVSFYPQAEPIDADQLLRQADQAMYQAKLAGKNRFHLFDAEHDRNLRGRHESIERLQEALEKREFVLHYQPKVDMRLGQVIGLEALLRWRHPEHGLLSPGSFLPVLEHHALVVDLGDWVIDAALAQIAAWRAAGTGLPVSVNVDAMQLDHPDFVTKLRASLARYPDVQPGDLELEILETSALDDIARVTRILLDAQALGVRFSLDDFGTGYSSLTYFRRLPVHTVKIDQSFVRDTLDDASGLAVLESTIGLASAFRRRVIAEGVETESHGEMLLKLGCELGQGYAIAHPMPVEHLQAWIDHWQPFRSWTQAKRMPRAQLPSLLALVEHRAWIQALRSYLEDSACAPPELGEHQCHFGRWLDAQTAEIAQYNRSDEHGIHPIVALHARVHQCAQRLIDLKQCGDAAQALARFGEIEAMRDALTDAMQHLVG